MANVIVFRERDEVKKELEKQHLMNLRLPSKYRNSIVTTSCGKLFHSEAEYNRYLVLVEYEKRGDIKYLGLQTKFILVDTIIKMSYVCDFSYITSNDLIVIEDVKNAWLVKDKYFRIKKKLFEYTYNHPIYLLDPKNIGLPIIAENPKLSIKMESKPDNDHLRKIVMEAGKKDAI